MLCYSNSVQANCELAALYDDELNNLLNQQLPVRRFVRRQRQCRV